MDEVPPTFFSKLGEALKLIEEYKQLFIFSHSESRESPGSGLRFPEANKKEKIESFFFKKIPDEME
jgi:hypothetical protein